MIRNIVLLIVNEVQTGVGAICQHARLRVRYV